MLMKTKYFLSSMVLTALFAACTNDDFETIQNSGTENPVLANRAKGELILHASKVQAAEGDADTRIVGEEEGTEIKWLWENADDKIGALVVDYKATGVQTNNSVIATAYDAYMITNYPFAPHITEPQQGAEFSTPTAVVEGAYMFYNRYNGNDTQRKALSHEIARIQNVKAGKEAGLVQVGTPENGGQNFFVSPVVDMAIPDESTIELPVSVTSARSILRFYVNANLKAKEWGNFEVNKITIEALGKQKFMRKLTVDPQDITDIQLALRGEQGSAYYNWFLPNGAIKTRNADGSLVSEEQVNEAMLLVAEAMSTVDPATGKLRSIGVESESTDVLTYQLEEPYVFEDKDDQLEVMVVVPSGTYENATGLDSYQGVTEGFFLVSVYTNEGVYHKYISSNKGDAKRTLARGARYGMNLGTICTLPGYVNLDEVYSPENGFQIETTEDWNYAIEYIGHNSNDFGKGSRWGIPKFSLKENTTIDVDAEHYLRDYEVIYTGNATLNLVGQSEYRIPTGVIFADKENRPTLQVMDQPNAKVVFDRDINNGIDGSDGVNVTKAIKLVSDAQIVVEEGAVVDFEKLVNYGTMTIEKDITTEDEYGNVNNADITKAVIVKDGEGENYGEIIVAGQLEAVADFMNYKDAKITVNGFLNEMNDNNRGKASFAKLTNNGVLDIEKGGTNKGTYGGYMKVKNLVNSSNVLVNGELVVDNVKSTGTITVAQDPYALIQLKSGSVTENGVGSVVLAEASQFEMYDEYYNNWSNVDVKGIIETTIDSQEEYIAVLRNYNLYYKEDEERTALEVLNKITLTAPIKLLGNVERGNYTSTFKGIDFYLKDNAWLDVTGLKKNVTFGGIYSQGTNNAITIDAGATLAAKANYVEVAAGADLTLANGLTLTVTSNANKTTLNINGTLTNNGNLNNGTNVNKPLVTYVGSKGILNNQGVIGHEPKPIYMFTAEQIEIMNQLNDMVNDVDVQQDEVGYHITTANWRNITDKELRAEVVEAWVNLNDIHSQSNGVKVENQTYYVWKSSGIYWQFGESGENSIADPKVESNDANIYTEAWKADKVQSFEYKQSDFVADEALLSYILINDNYGIVNLNLKKYGTNNPAEAYGYILNNHHQKNGDFTIDLGEGRE